MQKTIAVLAGDGIGPEVTAQAIKALQKVAKKFNHQFDFKEALVGAVAIDATGNPLPPVTLNLCIQSDAILFGAIGHPKFDNNPHATIRPEQGLLALRQALGLYANIRPIKSYPQLADASPLKAHIVKGVDFVVVRELINGIYFGKPRGRSEDGNTAFDSCVYDKEAILRATKVAFEFAQQRRKKVTLVDKANVLATSRLWREVVTDYAQQFPDIELEVMYVDNAAMRIIQSPRYFDVVLTGNLFGDILTDEASVITGSLGTLASASIGLKTSLFEPIHGSYPQATGKNIANPIAAILSAAMLLNYSFGLMEESQAIETAVQQALDKGMTTEDINQGTYTTTEVGDFIANAI